MGKLHVFIGTPVIIILMLLGCTPHKSPAPITAASAVATATPCWQVVGGVRGVTNQTVYITQVKSYHGTPYVAFEDFSYNPIQRYVSCMKFNGSAWEYLGGAFVSADISWVGLDINSAGVPYVSVTHNDTDNKMSVFRFFNNAWEPVGPQRFTSDTFMHYFMLINDVPYVIFRDSANSGKATVMKYNGASWEIVGLPGFSSDQIDRPTLTYGNGKLYAAYRVNALKGEAAVYDGTSWTLLGPAGGCTPGDIWNPFILFFNNAPYFGFNDMDAGMGAKTTVMNYNGSSWGYAGARAFTNGQALTMFMDSFNGVLYSGYADYSLNKAAYCMKYEGGAWSQVGGQVSLGETRDTSLCVDQTTGTVYMAFNDFEARPMPSSLTVMKYE